MATLSWRVALLEDDAEIRGYFKECIAGHPSLQLVASFGLLAHARSWFDSHTADVLLTDLGLPDGNGIDLLRHLATTQPACEVIVVSVFGDEDTVLSCVEAGAVGYIHKDATPADVAQTILDVKGGASPISPMIARKVLDRVRQTAAPRAQALDALNADLLSPREAEVLELIARGLSYAEIAQLKGVTMHTVQTHIKNLYGKLAVHSRSEAVFEAGRMGLLSSLKSRD
jgi:DNA-binding NarL/FixJ family response regulator